MSRRSLFSLVLLAACASGFSGEARAATRAEEGGEKHLSLCVSARFPLDCLDPEIVLSCCYVGGKEAVTFTLPAPDELAFFQGLAVKIDGAPAPRLAEVTDEATPKQSRLVTLKRGEIATLNIRLGQIYKIPRRWTTIEISPLDLGGKRADVGALMLVRAPDTLKKMLDDARTAILDPEAPLPTKFHSIRQLSESGETDAIDLLMLLHAETRDQPAVHQAVLGGLYDAYRSFPHALRVKVVSRLAVDSSMAPGERILFLDILGSVLLTGKMQSVGRCVRSFSRGERTDAQSAIEQVAKERDEDKSVRAVRAYAEKLLAKASGK